MKEKDWNYIAKLEKAIKKQYGEEAIQNPKSNWDKEKEQEYLKQLEIVAEKERKHIQEEKQKVNIEGFLVSKKLLNKETDRVCPVCEKYCFGKKHTAYLNKFESCVDCYIKYAEDPHLRKKDK